MTRKLSAIAVTPVTKIIGEVIMAIMAVATVAGIMVVAMAIKSMEMGIMVTMVTKIMDMEMGIINPVSIHLNKTALIFIRAVLFNCNPHF